MPHACGCAAMLACERAVSIRVATKVKGEVKDLPEGN